MVVVFRRSVQGHLDPIQPPLVQLVHHLRGEKRAV
jgi:hypothetical protein